MYLRKEMRVLMKRIIIFLTICIFSAISEKLLYAQSNNADTPIEILSINGLEVGGKYTREQIFAALGGQPNRIIQSEDDPRFFEYYYDKDVFFQMDDEFYGGSIVSSRFYITKGIRVGESIEAINQLKGICTAGEYAKSRYAGGVRWKPIKNDTWDWQVVNFYYNSQGEIAGIKIYVYYY